MQTGRTATAAGTVPTAAPEAYGPSVVSVSPGSALAVDRVHDLVQPRVPAAGMNVCMACYTREGLPGAIELLIAHLLYAPRFVRAKSKGAE